MEIVINGTPNKEGVGITGIGLRNNEAYSRAHFLWLDGATQQMMLN